MALGDHQTYIMQIALTAKASFDPKETDPEVIALKQQYDALFDFGNTPPAPGVYGPRIKAILKSYQFSDLFIDGSVDYGGVTASLPALLAYRHMSVTAVPYSGKGCLDTIRQLAATAISNE